jgi:CO/xanthine dehydrogenase FAD-binding subunit
VDLPVSLPDLASPDSLSEALRLAARGDVRMLAGGTDLYPGAGSGLAGAWLDLSRLPDLQGLAFLDGGLRIGAMTTWSQIAVADLPPALRGLQQAARQVGGVQVQNAGTLGGNLCNASPAADGVPPLLALGAEVELASVAGRRRMALAAFLLGPRRTALAPGEVLVAVLIPAASLSGRSAFVKLGARSHLVISIAMAAARVEVADRRIVRAAVAVGACSAVAVRLPGVEAALAGVPVGEAAARVRSEDVTAPLAPIDDIRATAAYRRGAATELVRRAIVEALA